ncbi:hypothetical protein COCMIDRAFT_84541 [Bipolaris oryzae ATCC 44560]|uniref:L-dopachrome isomerase n=1 Tax=Bipolaris oryzae ATCC 44560 TaxID=930090 RepID=W6ZHS2_COCMI|nr:uncharacterized protein COCMIDRAFT_84541 [Bipolaris oryzae ATCC 44560]EUC49493.1 hypothetical protein COCMIDRAFT_84541 [Bipolaris oryzae ATCC 44560]
MSRPSSTSTQSATAFPKQAGAALLSPDNNNNNATAGPQSPSASNFSFASSPHSVIDVPDNSHQYPRETAPHAPGSLRPMTSRARAQFYESQFVDRGSNTSSARDRVTKDAPIVAELRTNVIIKDEYTLVTDLSHHLSTRYQRPETSIMITVNHSACLLLGGSFEPTYVLTINALPVQVQPTTNKRNAALIQTFMAESIGVPSDRGIIKFVPIPEDSLAINGMTILGEIERLERQHAEENGGSIVKRATTKSSRKSAMTKAKSSMQLSRGLSKAEPVPKPVTAADVPRDGPLDSAVAISDSSVAQRPVSKMSSKSKMSTKKSEPILSVFAKSTTLHTNLPPPPPIPDDRPMTPSISKRHSFMKVFRR